ncbi:PREDICTED: methyltransferase-like protein 23 isoform X3 [Hipposideros armiger]|uniref:Methyltransferase-like protein 23 isoform X3 n=1 Tax=Hipposideros armiger TaxID=186990 RepID=A0A8B7RHX8_HIPAR|nr:PREDICTED: methyltransferase-like protein 23 isoform X3 [Hipposideros armiger]
MWSGPSAFGSRRSQVWERRGPCWRSASRRSCTLNTECMFGPVLWSWPSTCGFIEDVCRIGAGASLPGIVAAKCGAEVILSDSSELPHCLEICRQSCQMNALPQVPVVGLTWGHVSQDLLALPSQDIILASDVFFEPEDFEDILTTVYFLMQKNPKVQLWSTYQVRSADWSLEALLYKWDMKCIHIPLESFDADKEDIAESALPGRHTVEMLVISFAKDSL